MHDDERLAEAESPTEPGNSVEAQQLPGSASESASVAAFFDVDNTMIVGASIFYFAKGLAARHFFSWRDLGRFTVRQLKLRARGESADDMHRTRDAALAFVAGKKVVDIVALGEQTYDESMAARVWPETHALARAHLAEGTQVWLVTATPQDLARIMAQRLGLTGAIGTVAETSEGSYTGRLVGDVLHGEAKAAAVRDLAVREGLDLARCYAYSDSINDLPLLTLVGNPVAVNPDSALRGEARTRGWEIRDFRTGRRAAKIGVPALLGAGAIAGGAVAVNAYRRRGGLDRWRARARELSARRNVALQAAGRASPGSSPEPGR